MAHADFELWLEFELWQSVPEFDPADDFCNIVVTFPDNTEYALNVWTYKFLSKAIADSELRGDGLCGKYMLPPDLFVERLDRQLLEETLSDLIARGQLKEEWLTKPND
jgi:hypothetical protein